MNDTSVASTDPRVYWTDRMDQAALFMQQMRDYPIVDCGERLLPMSMVTENLAVSFSESKINNYYPRIFSLREGLLPSFRDIAAEINARGWILRVEEGYRTPTMQRELSRTSKLFDAILQKVLWELRGEIPSPDFMLQRVGALIATRCRVGTHISGSAIDVSIVDQATGRDVDRGGPYCEFSEKSPMNSPFISECARMNRREIERICLGHGWVAYPFEFWHFSKGDVYAENLSRSGRPARYGPVEYDGLNCRIIGEQEADELLEPVEFYESEILASLARLASFDPSNT